MNEEINQLIRMAQVLRVRSGNLSREIQLKMPAAKDQAKKAGAVHDLAAEAEKKLNQIYAYFD